MISSLNSVFPRLIFNSILLTAFGLIAVNSSYAGARTSRLTLKNTADVFNKTDTQMKIHLSQNTSNESTPDQIAEALSKDSYRHPMIVKSAAEAAYSSLSTKETPRLKATALSDNSLENPKQTPTLQDLQNTKKILTIYNSFFISRKKKTHLAEKYGFLNLNRRDMKVAEASVNLAIRNLTDKLKMEAELKAKADLQAKAEIKAKKEADQKAQKIARAKQVATGKHFAGILNKLKITSPIWNDTEKNLSLIAKQSMMYYIFHEIKKPASTQMLYQTISSKSQIEAETALRNQLSALIETLNSPDHETSARLFPTMTAEEKTTLRQAFEHAFAALPKRIGIEHLSFDQLHQNFHPGMTSLPPITQNQKKEPAANSTPNRQLPKDPETQAPVLTTAPVYKSPKVNRRAEVEAEVLRNAELFHQLHREQAICRTNAQNQWLEDQVAQMKEANKLARKLEQEAEGTTLLRNPFDLKSYVSKFE